MNATNPASHLFTVSLGIDLPSETVKRITQAIQKAVLAELASAELDAPVAIDFTGQAQATSQAKAAEGSIGLPVGGTQGIWVTAR